MMKKLKKWLIYVSLITVAFLPSNAYAQRNLEQIKTSGQLVMGTGSDYPPFDWMMMEDGKEKLVGIDVDLAQLIADELGVELVIHLASFDSLIPSLISGRVDMVLAALTYTPERAEQVLFSDVYYETMSQFMVTVDQADSYSSLADFQGIKIGVQKSSIQEEMVKANLPEADLVAMTKNGDLIESLKAQRVDALFFDGVLSQTFQQLNADQIVSLAAISMETNKEGFAVAVSKGNDDLITIINEVISKALASGELDNIIQQNIERSASEIVD